MNPQLMPFPDLEIAASIKIKIMQVQDFGIDIKLPCLLEFPELGHEITRSSERCVLTFLDL